MRQVTKQVFNNFLKDKNVKRIAGDYFHSEYWIDENNNKIAYLETSSWGAPDVYMIESDDIEYLETMELINNILNRE